MLWTWLGVSKYAYWFYYSFWVEPPTNNKWKLCQEVNLGCLITRYCLVTIVEYWVMDWSMEWTIDVWFNRDWSMNMAINVWIVRWIKWVVPIYIKLCWNKTPYIWFRIYIISWVWIMSFWYFFIYIHSGWRDILLTKLWLLIQLLLNVFRFFG